MSMFSRMINPLTMWVAPNYFLGAIAGSVIGGLFGSSSADKAAKAAAKSEAAKIAETRRQFDITQEQFATYREAGGRGLAEYEQRLGGYGEAEGLIRSDIPEAFQFGAEEFQQYKDPGYEFRLGEGERALSRGMAGLGKRLSGERAAGLMQYGQQMGSQEFGAARGRAAADYENRMGLEQEAYQRSLGQYGRQYTDPMRRYQDLATMGQSAVAQTAAQRQAATESITSSMGAAGQAKAAGVLGQAGAWGGAIRDIGQQFTGAGGGLPFYGGSAAANGGGSPLSGYAASPSQYDWSR